MSTNEPLTKHKWVSVYHWIEEKYSETDIPSDIFILLRSVDEDIIEQYYGSEMSDDGYYDEILEDECPECQQVIKLEDAAQCIECEGWFHGNMDCIDMDSYYKDPICYSCQEMKESIHQ